MRWRQRGRRDQLSSHDGRLWTAGEEAPLQNIPIQEVFGGHWVHSQSTVFQFSEEQGIPSFAKTCGWRGSRVCFESPGPCVGQGGQGSRSQCPCRLYGWGFERLWIGHPGLQWHPILAIGSFQIRQGQRNVMAGDVGDPSVVAGLHPTGGQFSTLSGGFSCQPWSQLGDKKGLMDARGSSLAKILKTARWLKVRTILLECVSAAGKDEEVQLLLKDFCHRTGFRMTTGEVHLESIMPAKRSRWWRFLFDASVPQFCIRPLPTTHPKPVLSDLLPVLPVWDEVDLEQLSLDRYETNKFMEFGGLFTNIFTTDEQVRTALRGWANQLTRCPCGCRRFPFSEERLRSKEIFGALIPLQGEFHTYQGTLPMTRRMHPWEMACIHGANPNRMWKPNMRLGIAAAGHMATPLQSCWVMAQCLSRFCGIISNYFYVHSTGSACAPQPCIRPGIHWRLHQCLVAFCPFGPMKKSSTARGKDARTFKGQQTASGGGVRIPLPMTFQAMPGDFPTAPGHRSRHKLQLWPEVFVQPRPTAQSVSDLPIGATEEYSNSQRKGRKDPLSSEKNIQKPEGIKQPAVETQEFSPPIDSQAMPESPAGLPLHRSSNPNQPMMSRHSRQVLQTAQAAKGHLAETTQDGKVEGPVCQEDFQTAGSTNSVGMNQICTIPSLPLDFVPSDQIVTEVNPTGDGPIFTPDEATFSQVIARAIDQIDTRVQEQPTIITHMIQLSHDQFEQPQIVSNQSRRHSGVNHCCRSCIGNNVTAHLYQLLLRHKGQVGWHYQLNAAAFSAWTWPLPTWSCRPTPSSAGIPKKNVSNPGVVQPGSMGS